MLFFGGWNRRPVTNCGVGWRNVGSHKDMYVHLTDKDVINVGCYLNPPKNESQPNPMGVNATIIIPNMMSGMFIPIS